MLTPIQFTISNTWTVTSQVELSCFKSDLSEMFTIVGRYRNVESVPFNSIVFGSVDNLASITINNISPVQGTEDQISAVFERIRKAIRDQTGRAMLTGKDLTIQTGQ